MYLKNPCRLSPPHDKLAVSFIYSQLSLLQYPKDKNCEVICVKQHKNKKHLKGMQENDEL